jgi:hypothetical protein
LTQDPLKKQLDGLKRAIDERESAKVYQLPFWPNPQRGLPNEVIRSALFSAIRAQPTEALSDADIATIEGYRITYTGMKLDQSHLDVFEGVMHFARGVHEGNKVRFTARSFLNLLGRSTGKSDRQWLLHVFRRLTASSVTIDQDGKRLFWGSLLPGGAYDEEEKVFVVEINRQLAKLFDRGLTRIQFEQRKQLRRKPLAQWLHLYYASHAKPFAVSVRFLAEKSGSKTQNLKHFRENLKAALGELVAIGFLASFTVNDRDLVEVLRTPREALSSAEA